MKSEIKLERAFIFYVATLLFFGVGAITTLGLNWYDALAKPWWTPPELLVAAIWATLFICTAISVALFWERYPKTEKAFTSILSFYMTNAVLTLFWNYLFFGVHQFDTALSVAILIGISVLVLMVRLWHRCRTSALLLFPYLMWMLYALSFTYTLIRLNP